MARLLALCTVLALSLAPAFADSDLPAAEQNIIDVINRASSGVVAINVNLRGQRLNPFEEQQGGGSGFLVENNQIVTNYHVIAPALRDNSVELVQGASIYVIFADDPDQEHEARMVGAMLDYDLALLELEDANALPDAARPIPFGDSQNVQVGQQVIAIGNPFGLRFTATTGIVSAVERETHSLFGISIPFIQTDAAVNPGNSGGPLLNSRGELIGINNAILSPSGTFVGVSFAVPGYLLEENLESLRAGGLSGIIASVTNPNQPRMGISSEISVADYPDALRERFALPEQGAVVTSVVEGGPAAQAGLQAPDRAITVGNELYPLGGDIIIEADGAPISEVRDLQRIIANKTLGDTIALQVWNEGELRRVEVGLEVIGLSRP